MFGNARAVRHRRVGLLVALVVCAGLGACASGPSEKPGGPWPSRQTTRSERAEVVKAALQEVGTPYRYGGDSPGGFDCSGLVEYAFSRAGVALPRTTASQRRHGRRIAFSKARAGDLLFYHFPSGGSDLHVGLYLGHGRMVHASSGADRVQVTDIDKSYWWRHFLAAVRVLP